MYGQVGLYNVPMNYLVNNYQRILEVIETDMPAYAIHITKLLNFFRACLIVHIAFHFLFYISIAYLTVRYIRTCDLWVEECMDMMASTPIEVSIGCIKYYQMLKNRKYIDSISQKSIGLELEEFTTL
jgi:hypothetical protein